MTVRELIKQLLDFNPDAKIRVVTRNGESVCFSLAWGALDGEGMDMERATSVSIYLEGGEEKNNTNQELTAEREKAAKLVELLEECLECYHLDRNIDKYIAGRIRQSLNEYKKQKEEK